MRNLFISFCIYTSSELTYHYYTQQTYNVDSIKRILCGTFIDAIMLRRFHRNLDTNYSFLSPIQKMAVEQLTFAPFSTFSFLVINNNFSLENWKQIYTNDFLYWSFMSSFSYKLFSHHNRFIFISLCSYIWSNYRLLNFIQKN